MYHTWASKGKKMCHFKVNVQCLMQFHVEISTASFFLLFLIMTVFSPLVEIIPLVRVSALSLWIIIVKRRGTEGDRDSHLHFHQCTFIEHCPCAKTVWGTGNQTGLLSCWNSLCHEGYCEKHNAARAKGCGAPKRSSCPTLRMREGCPAVFSQSPLLR